MNYNSKTKKELISEIERLNRKLARLHTSEGKQTTDKYDDVLLLLDSIIWERDINTAKITSVSPQIKKHLGFPTKQWIDDPSFWQMAIHEDDREIAIATLQKAIDEKKDTSLEYRMVAANNEVVWIRDKISVVVKNNKIKKLYGIMTNISMQKETENELLNSQANLELFFAQSLDGFFIMMLDEPIQWNDTVDKEKVMDYVLSHYRITRFNNAMLQLYGMTWEEFSRINLDKNFTHGLEEKRELWRQLYDSGHLHVESQERRHDGTEIWIEGDYICLYDDEERITGHFGIQREITDRKEALEDLKMTQFAIDHAKIGVFQVDDDGQIHYAN